MPGPVVAGQAHFRIWRSRWPSLSMAATSKPSSCARMSSTSSSVTTPINSSCPPTTGMRRTPLRRMVCIRSISESSSRAVTTSVVITSSTCSVLGSRSAATTAVTISRSVWKRSTIRLPPTSSTTTRQPTWFSRISRAAPFKGVCLKAMVTLRVHISPVVKRSPIEFSPCFPARDTSFGWRLTHAMLAQTHALGLESFTTRFGDELHGAANLQVVKRRTRHVVAAEVILVASRCTDEAKTPGIVQAHKLAMQRQCVLLLLPPALAHDVLKLAFHVVESIAQSNVHVFVLDPVHHEFVARQREVDAHAERAALMLVLLFQVDMDMASHDVGGERFEPVRMFTRACLKRVGMLHVVKLNVNRKLHLVPFAGIRFILRGTTANRLRFVNARSCDLIPSPLAESCQPIAIMLIATPLSTALPESGSRA